MSERPLMPCPYCARLNWTIVVEPSTHSHQVECASVWCPWLAAVDPRLTSIVTQMYDDDRWLSESVLPGGARLVLRITLEPLLPGMEIDYSRLVRWPLTADQLTGAEFAALCKALGLSSAPQLGAGDEDARDRGLELAKGSKP